MDSESDNESPPKKKQRLETQNSEFENGFIPHTEINKIVSFTAHYYKSNISLHLDDYVVIEIIVGYLKKKNVQNVYHELFASDWNIQYTYSGKYSGKYYVQWLCGKRDDYSVVPLNITLEKPWLNDENYEFIGYISRKCRRWRAITNSEEGIFKWQVFLLDEHWWRDLDDDNSDGGDESGFDKLMCGTFESAAGDQPNAVCLYEIKWDWKTDEFVKTLLAQRDLYDIYNGEYKYKKHFVKNFDFEYNKHF